MIEDRASLSYACIFAAITLTFAVIVWRSLRD